MAARPYAHLHKPHRTTKKRSDPRDFGTTEMSETPSRGHFSAAKDAIEKRNLSGFKSALDSRELSHKDCRYELP